MPDAIAHYKILGPLGAGGLGEVYRARDTNSAAPSPSRSCRRRSPMTRPPRARCSIPRPPDRAVASEHRHAVREPARKAISGSSCSSSCRDSRSPSLIDGRALNVRRALEFAINLADALADAHAAEMIHGDIRPDTIMITPKDRAKFVNFGLSRFTAGGAARLSPPRRTSRPKSSPAQPASPRSDIYSLGAVMFEMLTGRQRARGLVLSGLNASVPAELEQMVGRMLAANVEHRAQSAATIAAELRSIAAILDTRTEAAEAAEAAEPPAAASRAAA